jgi:hypothetical protein
MRSPAALRRALGLDLGGQATARRQCVAIPAGTVHRTRALGRTVSLTVEALGAGTVVLD